jgi:uncharacterized RDD family membrane protein YckC
VVDEPAGFWIRLGATILDGLLLMLVVGVLGSIVFNTFFMDGYTPLDLIELLYYLLIPIFWHGYTVGKRACGIRIARVDGEKVGIGTMLLRQLVGGLVYVLTFGIGVIISAFMVGLGEDKRSIHDFIAGTYVTHLPPGFEE